MDLDEKLARELQDQFDKEDKSNTLQVEKDASFAQEIAVKAHQLSDSESEDEVVYVSNKKDVEERTISENTANQINEKNLPLCQYGADCYRKNATHLKEFWHPTKGRNSNQTDSEPVSKKLKKENSATEKRKSISTTSQSNQSTSKMDDKLPFHIRLEKSEPYNLFLNKVYSVPDTHSDSLSLVLPDLLSPSIGTLKESAQINFMVDPNFLKEYYSACNLMNKPILIMYEYLEGEKKDFPGATYCLVRMPFQYGVHHSKIMIFQYDEGLRIVIHTANLVPDDWQEKTQGFWVSPLFPPLENGKSTLLDGESVTCFKRDFVDYLLSYKSPDLIRWSHIVKSYDFSSCRVVFIGSVPGYHMGEARYKYGHQKVRNLLRKHSSWKPGISCPVIVQCSSIGSLGKDAKTWLTGELGVSLGGGNEISNSTVQMIYPSEEDIRNSSQGYGGGSCLPYHSSTHVKQSWLIQHLHGWRSEVRKRTRSMPHIKTYTRLRKLKEMQYFLLTSANLSKAAWGQIQKNGSQVFIRSYEAGVLLLPKYLNGEDSFSVDGTDANFPLPYDIPLTPYAASDRPWFKDTEKQSPDILGNTYP